MEESVFNQSPFSNEPSGKGPSTGRGKKILFLVVILVVLGAIAFGAVKLLGSSSEKAATPTPAPTIEIIPTEEPTATPEAKISGTPAPTKKVTPAPTTSAKITPKPTSSSTTGSTDKSKFTVNVQNGSGVTGAAKKMGDLLTTLGYTLGSVGNADASSYTQTEIHVKATAKDLLTILKKDLGANYVIGTAAADYTGSGDALVIVGKE